MFEIEHLGVNYNEILVDLCKFAYDNRLYSKALILKNMVDLRLISNHIEEFHLLASKIEKKMGNLYEGDHGTAHRNQCRRRSGARARFPRGHPPSE